MLEKDVPQDVGMAAGLKEVCYAVDEQGRYVLVPSAGWEPKNITNSQAWEVIQAELEAVRRQVVAGDSSPIAYFMTKNLMDVGLLAQYVGLWRWRVKRHLKTSVFKKLSPATLARYAAVFAIPVEELLDVSRIANQPPAVREK
jgi:hypothetical protein